MDNHKVSVETEEAIRRYLDDNDLDLVKVAINQYEPLDDWRRLRANKTMGWGYRYTFGVLSVAGEAILERVTEFCFRPMAPTWATP